MVFLVLKYFWKVLTINLFVWPFYEVAVADGIIEGDVGDAVVLQHLKNFGRILVFKKFPINPVALGRVVAGAPRVIGPAVENAPSRHQDRMGYKTVGEKDVSRFRLFA